MSGGFPVNRRTLLKGAAAGAAASAFPLWPATAQQTVRNYGLSYFGDLKYGPDFRHFDYANPDAPKGGRIVTQLWAWGYNQNPSTFNTLNIHRAAGRRRRGNAVDLRISDGGVDGRIRRALSLRGA
jgi:microcin C transport system substrate-binding protein